MRRDQLIAKPPEGIELKIMFVRTRNLGVKQSAARSRCTWVT